MSPISHRSGWSVTQWGQIVYQIACLKMRKWIRLKLILNWINLALKQETGAREISKIQIKLLLQMACTPLYMPWPTIGILQQRGN